MLLAINTATPALSLALLEDGALVAEATEDVGAAHSEAMFVLLAALFDWTGRDRKELRAVGVATGPGGFTGLRTGIALAKAVSQALDIPAYGVGTLEALAYQFPGPHAVSAMLDARRGNVFAGLFRAGAGGLETLLPGKLYAIEEWCAVLTAHEGAILAVGEGATRHRERLLELTGVWVPPDALMATRATTVGLVAAERLAAGMPSEAAAIAPVYLREPQAVVNWEAAQKAAGEKTDAEYP